MYDYSKYERKFDWNTYDLNFNKISIGDYEKTIRKIVDEIKTDSIDDFQEWLKTQAVGVDSTTNEVLVVDGVIWRLAIDEYKKIIKENN